MKRFLVNACDEAHMCDHVPGALLFCCARSFCVQTVDDLKLRGRLRPRGGGGGLNACFLCRVCVYVCVFVSAQSRNRRKRYACDSDYPHYFVVNKAAHL